MGLVDEMFAVDMQALSQMILPIENENPDTPDRIKVN